MITGIAGSSSIAAIGFRKRSLSGSGAVAAVMSGSLTTARGGYGRAALLVAFFVSSSLLSRLGIPRGGEIRRYTEKSDRRDACQVTANGGVSTAIAVLGDGPRYLLPYVGSLAAVTGDTWATEIGSQSPNPPRYILTGRRVPAGTSGGVSLLGTIASAAGGVFIGTLAALAGSFDSGFRQRKRSLLVTGIAAGATGSLIDSLLGATIQERRWCDECWLPTERRVHTCGTPTRIVGGIPGLDNDVVNLLCSLTGAGIGWLIQSWTSRDTTTGF